MQTVTWALAHLDGCHEPAMLCFRVQSSHKSTKHL